jgi:hypothetical protein
MGGTNKPVKRAQTASKDPIGTSARYRFALVQENTEYGFVTTAPVVTAQVTPTKPTLLERCFQICRIPFLPAYIPNK